MAYKLLWSNFIKTRKLKKSDFLNQQLITSFLELLNSFRETSINLEKALDVFKKRSGCHTFIVLDNSKVIATYSMIIENKFINNFGIAAHIEDVVVSKDFRSQGLGKKLIENAIVFAKKKNCYKIILDCAEEVKDFYKKCGFEESKNCNMRFNYND